MFGWLNRLLGTEVNRKRYPINKFHTWEFIPLEHGRVLARVYLDELQEKTFDGPRAARRWVHGLLQGNLK